MRPITIIGFICICATAAVRGNQDPLSAAKDLYASAAYDEALVALARVDNAAPEIARAVDQYRASCLFALGRKAEAEDVAETLFRREPLAQLEDASPRIETMFQEVRKRLLPGMIRAEYKAAKAAIDEKNPARARPYLVSARDMIDEGMKLGVEDDGITDLQVLVDGFLDLMNAAAEQRQLASLPSDLASPASKSPGARSELAITPRLSAAVYGSEDEGVVPPVVIKQVIPRPPEFVARSITKPATAVVEVVVDESGAVRGTAIRQSLNPAYDDRIIAASRGWKYRPATKDGVPVKFRRIISITVR